MSKQIKQQKRILVILGPTATGKTKLAVKLAKKFNGEIVSADSRQVYKGMDIGTGKDLGEYNQKITNYKLQIITATAGSRSGGTNKFQNPKFKFQKIPYHLINVVSPKTDFNVAKFQKLAYKAIDDILKRGKLPIVVGGTGLYISAIVDGLAFSKSKVESRKSKAIRKKIEKLSLKQLLSRLKKIDIETSKIIDKKNRRRVQRALEIYYQTGKPKSAQQKNQPRYDSLQIGIPPLSGGARGGGRIEKRLNQRLRGGAMIKEVKNLHEKQKVTWKRLENFGLEYKWISYYLQGKVEYQEMKENLARDTKKFAKRQMTWFKRDKRIKWINDYRKVVTVIRN